MLNIIHKMFVLQEINVLKDRLVLPYDAQDAEFEGWSELCSENHNHSLRPRRLLKEA